MLGCAVGRIMQLSDRFWSSRLSEWLRAPNATLFLQICDSISLYGFTTWPDKAKSDHYYTKDKKKKSGLEWHDWGGESLAWRMLFAAGQMAICSN